MQARSPPVARVLALLAALILLFAACGGGDDGGDTSESTSAAPEPGTSENAATTTAAVVEPAALNLAFGGETCNYDGPTDLTPGPVELVFLNESEETAAVSLERYLGEETIQDMIDLIGEEPSSVHSPPWTLHLGTYQAVPAGETFRWEGDLEPGIHTMVCIRWSPHGVWFGAGLTVEG